MTRPATTARDRIALALELSAGEVIERARKVVYAVTHHWDEYNTSKVVGVLEAALATYDANAKRLAEIEKET